jgi:UDP-N-acetylmuramoyl-tripeptide--D-alanyl-D-alanine ligase
VEFLHLHEHTVEMLDIHGWVFVVLVLLNLANCLLYAARRQEYYLHMAQQTSYRPERYMRWLKGRLLEEFYWGDFLALFFAAAGVLLGGLPGLALTVLSPILPSLLWRRPPVKKALVWTERAKRLYLTALLLVLVLLCIFCGFSLFTTSYSYMEGNVILVLLSPVVMYLAVALRQPFENRRNQKFVADAERIISEMPNLVRIGITGSYGKTSSKMVLGRVLAEAKYTLVTPDSYNTPMGITLTVRNQLKPIHQVFVAEMGARQSGDIKELCDIVHPQIGIVTAIGPQHLETFKTVENVAATKFELIDSLPADGVAVLNFDDEIIAEKARNVKVKVLSYGLERSDVDYSADNIEFSPQGMSFRVKTVSGCEQNMHTKLLGRHNIYNILAACAAAEYLGLTLPEIAKAVAQVPPVEHRLVLKAAGNFTIIDDAFNSNPAGSKAAVDVLAAMPGGRKMIITPGMVELGAEQARLNREFAEYAASKLDYVVIVGQKQSEPLLEGLRAAAFPENKYFVADDLASASAHMRSWVRNGDYVLFENDLPDSYL